MKKTVLLFLVVAAKISAQFNTLPLLEKYCSLYPENPISDNEDWFNPEFTTFYKRLKPSFFDKLGKKFGFGSDSGWSPGAFRDLLERVLKQRQSLQFHDNVQTLQVKFHDKCIIWGDVHAALHSLVRCLIELHGKGEIDNNLVISSDSMYFVFIGDLISRSPYSLEVLTIVLLLMEKNPSKVFYLQGNHERNAYWENFSMRGALNARAKNFKEADDKSICLSNKINKFFNTLPRMLKIEYPNKRKEIIYCAHAGVSSSLAGGSNVEVLILGEQRLKVIKPTKGLEFGGFNHGTTQWSLLSCPIGIYKKYFYFHYDSFVMLTINNDIAHSTLTHFYQDIDQKDGFKKAVFNIVYGRIVKEKEVLQEKPNSNEYEFGSSLALTGVLASLGNGIDRGIDVALYKYNRLNGFQKGYTRSYIFDDSYVPRLARNNIERLKKENNIDIILLPVGTPTLATYSERFKKNGDIAVFFPYSGSEQFRKSDYTNIVHFKSSYSDEARALIQFIIKEHGAQKFAFFYQDDDYGLGPLNAAQDELKKNGITTWHNVPYTREQIYFQDQAQELRRYNPDAIGFFSTSAPTEELLSQIGADVIMGKQLFGISALETETLNKFLSNRGILINFTQIVPNPYESEIQIVQEYRKDMDERSLPYESTSLEGYIGAQLLFDAYSHIDFPVTKEKLLAWFESFNKYKFKGLTLTFDPKTRSFNQPMWIKTTDGLWIEVNDKNKPA